MGSSDISKVLITGPNGMLGSSLVPHLRASGFEVLGLSRNEPGGVDLADAGKMSAVLDRIRPDAIVNLAALTNVDECEREPQRAYLGNVRIVENLANWIRARKAPCHLVQISTDQVYDGVGPHVEAAVTLANYYGFSKYAGELVAAGAGGTILRTNFFGPSASAGRTSLSDWITRSLSRGEAITVFEDVEFSPLTMRSLATHIERVLRNPRRGVFNLGSREGMSKAEFAFALAAALRLPTDSMTRGDSTRVQLCAYRPKDMRMDSSAFEQAYDVRLPTLLEEIHSLRADHGQQAG